MEESESNKSALWLWKFEILVWIVYALNFPSYPGGHNNMRKLRANDSGKRLHISAETAPSGNGNLKH